LKSQRYKSHRRNVFEEKGNKDFER